MASGESEVSLADDRYLFLIIRVLVKEITAFDAKREELMWTHEIINPCIPDRNQTETGSLNLSLDTASVFFLCASLRTAASICQMQWEKETEQHREAYQSPAVLEFWKYASIEIIAILEKQLLKAPSSSTNSDNRLIVSQLSELLELSQF